MEQWVDVVGYEGKYKVSNFGRVLSCKRHCNHSKRGIKTVPERILKAGKDKDGYLQVNLCINGVAKLHKVHRLVAQAFVENPLNLHIINHIDENKQNNRADNLEYCTYKYNANYGSGKHKMGEKHKKPVVCIETATVYDSAIQAEKATGAGHISECCKDSRRTSGGYHWRYFNEH